MDPPVVDQDIQVSMQGVMTTAFAFGCLVLYTVGGLGMVDDSPDFAAEAVLPVLILVGSAWTLSRVRHGGSRWWLLPAATFLVGTSIVLTAWSDHVEDPRLEEDCTLDRPLPESVAHALTPFMWAGSTWAALASLVAGVTFLLRPATRWLGGWCLLATGTLALGAWALAMRCL